MDELPQDLIQLKQSHVAAASWSLADAFFEDGLVRRLCPDEAGRVGGILPVFRFSAGLAVRNGEGWATSEGMEGVALWLYSWRMTCPPWRWLLLGGMDIRRGLSPWSYRELTSVSDRIDRARDRVAPPRYLYLSSLGVRRPFRRQGLATRLVSDRVRLAAAEGLPTIVETNTPGSLEFYEAVGFVIRTSFRAAEMDYYVLEYRAR